jgi:hypothetical protein
MEDLKAEWAAAIASGDVSTLERVGPLLFPEPGATPAAEGMAIMATPLADSAREAQASPLPAGESTTLSATEFSARQHALLTELGAVNPGSPHGVALQGELEALLKAQYGEGPARPAGADEAFTLADQVSFPAGTAEPVRVGLLSLAALDDVPVPMIQSAIREISQARAMSPDAARRELEAEYGDRLPTVLRIADEVHLTLPPGLQAGIEAQELFSSPILVKHMLALRAWRQGGRGRG